MTHIDAERYEWVLARRRAGLTWRQIGAETGISGNAARCLHRRAVAWRRHRGPVLVSADELPSTRGLSEAEIQARIQRLGMQMSQNIAAVPSLPLAGRAILWGVRRVLWVVDFQEKSSRLWARITAKFKGKPA